MYLEHTAERVWAELYLGVFEGLRGVFPGVTALYLGGLRNLFLWIS